MYVGKRDWAFKINGKTGCLEIQVPKREAYEFEEMTVVAVSMMRMCQSIGAILDEFLKDEQKIKIKK